MADFTKKQVQVYTAPHELQKIIQIPECKGCCVAVDDDHMHITDDDSHCVSVYNSETCQFAKSFSVWGSSPGMFKSPRGIAVDSCGVVYVCDY